MGKLTRSLQRSLSSCFHFNTSSPSPTSAALTATTSAAALKNRLSTSLAERLPFLKETHDAAARQELRRHATPPKSQTHGHSSSLLDSSAASSSQQLPSSPTRSTVVGTLYGPRRGRVTFCVQQDPANPPPFLLELSIPTIRLAKEMQSGLLRIALECDRRDAGGSGRVRSLHSTPMWKAYCNGRRMGYAVRRRPTEKDRAILKTIGSTTAGAGVLGTGGGKDGEVMYMRASYERVVGSRDSESYHLINPAGSPDQELSVFLLRTG